MVGGDDRPAIGQAANAGPARVDHRFDGEDHSGLKLQTRARASVMQDLRLFMKLPADAVATVFMNYRITV